MFRLEGLQHADAAVLGGGLAGLLLGASLSQEGLRVAVIDTGADTALPEAVPATLLCAPIMSKIEGIHGLSIAQHYAESLQTQLHALNNSCMPYVQELPAYAYAAMPAELSALECQHDLYKKLHIPVSIAPDAGGCPFPVELSLLLPGQAVVNLPLWKSALTASIHHQGGRVYTNSYVTALDSGRICTVHGCVDAQHIILMCGIPPGVRSRRLLSLLESRLTVSCRLMNPFPLHSIQQPVQKDGLYLYPAAPGAIAIWDAGRLGMRRQAESLARFEQLLQSRLPDWQQGEIQYASSVVSADGLPVIGTAPNSSLLCAAAYHGVLGAMHAAEVLARRILGRPLPEDAIYAPGRTLPLRFLRRLLRRSSGIYLGNLHRRNTPACPHCHCRMRYMASPQQWACPYCGSLFTMLGLPVSGPSTQPAQVSIRQRPDL